MTQQAIVEKTDLKPAHSKLTRVLVKLITNRSWSLFAVILITCIIMSILYPDSFFSFYNFKTIFETLSFEGILAIGMMYLLVSGMFDLSVGTGIAYIGAIAALTFKLIPGIPVPLGIMIVLGAGLLGGMVNGFVVAYIRINPLITTLAMMNIYRGIARVLLNRPIALPEEVLPLGQETLFGLEYPAIVYIALLIILGFLLAKSSYFRQLLFIGTNEKAAALSGINVKRVIFFNFALMGLLLGIAGMLRVAKTSAAIALVGDGVELRVIVAVIVGGASLMGGKGTIVGAFMGIVFMSVIGNVLILASVPLDLHKIVYGLMLIIIVILDVKLQKMKN